MAQPEELLITYISFFHFRPRERGSKGGWRDGEVRKERGGTEN